MAQAGNTKKNLNKTESTFSEVKSFFTSVRTTIFLLFTLAAASIIGTLVPQEAGLEKLQSTVNPVLFRVIVILDLHQMFHSWWFLLLLILLALNLLGCLLQRVPSIASEWKPGLSKASFVKEFSDPRAPGKIKEIVVGSLTRLLRASPEEDSVDGSITLMWTKHRTQLLGFPFVHCGIVFILLGGLIGLFSGYKGQVIIREGQTESEYVLFPSREFRKLPFTITLDRFTFLRYMSGAPKEWRSDVTFRREGAAPVKEAIRVNHPATIDGISFYQSSYERLGGAKVEVSLSGPGGKKDRLILHPGGAVSVPGTDYTATLQAIRQATTPKGLEIVIEAQAPGKEPIELELFEKGGPPAKLGDLEIGVLGLVPYYATILQLGYDPGTNVVWFGCLLLVLGFFLTLFTNHRRLRVVLTPREHGTRVELAGRSRRMRREFREAVEKRLDESLGLTEDRRNPN